MEPITDHDLSADLQQQVEHASKTKTLLNIVGGGSKAFLGVTNNAKALDVRHHEGVISYEPTELVVRARSGTPLATLINMLSDNGQMLPFEPPAFGTEATIGGTVACALAGPARPYLGGVRDYVLGCQVLNGNAQSLRFGGEVMKNVAGYDVSRLMTGAMGTLGVLLDVSVKVLPKAECETTLAQSLDESDAIEAMQALAGSGLPVTASAYIDGNMYTRLSSTDGAIKAAASRLPGDSIDNPQLWTDLKEHTLPFFNTSQPLWRISVPALTPAMNIEGNWLHDWAGMQRWLKSDTSATEIRNACEKAGGHATLYRASETLQREAGVFHPPAAPLLTLQQRLKNEFDPAGLFNHQRLFPQF